MKLTFNIEKRYVYVIVALLVLVAGLLIVNATIPGQTPNPGHPVTDLGVPTGCTANQFLKFDGTNWVCGTVSGGGLSCQIVEGTAPLTVFGLVGKYASCPAGTIVTGGGHYYQHHDTIPGYLISIPYKNGDVDGWFCRGSQTTTKCYAVCCQ